MYKIDYFFELFRSVSHHVNIKLFAGAFVVAMSFLFDSAMKDAMIAVFVLCLLDFATAIAAVRRTPGALISSSGVWRTAAKIGIYFLLISSGRLSEIATNFVIPILDETIVGFLAMTELISILENAGKMGYAVPKTLLKKLSDYRDSK